MDYFWFALFVLALVVAFFLLHRSEKKTKNKYKIDAYRLLDAPDPTPKEIEKTIKMLRLYGGTWRKDKEFVALANKLIARLNNLESSGRETVST
jgi:hypothetical protein